MNSKDIQKKISGNIKRKLAKYECIQIAKLIKTYGVQIVYDSVNESGLEEYGEWYYQVKNMCDYKLEFGGREKEGLKDILNAKKFRAGKMGEPKDT